MSIGSRFLQWFIHISIPHTHPSPVSLCPMPRQNTSPLGYPFTKHIPNQALFSLPYNLPHQSSNPVEIRYRSPAYFHFRHRDLLSIYIYFSHSIPLFRSISPHSPFPSLPPLQPHPHTSHPAPFIHPRNKTPSDPNPYPLPPIHISHFPDASRSRRRSAFVRAWGGAGRCGFKSFVFFLRNLGRGGGERRGEGSCFPWGGGLGGFM